MKTWGVCFPPLSPGRLNENHMRKYSLVRGAKCELQRGKSDWFPVTNNNICVKPAVFFSVRGSSFSNRSQTSLDSRRFGDLCYYLCASVAQISTDATRCGKYKLCFHSQLIWPEEEPSWRVFLRPICTERVNFQFQPSLLKLADISSADIWTTETLTMTNCKLCSFDWSF